MDITDKNREFFEIFHIAVIKNKLEKVEEDGAITTMRIAGMEHNGKEYLLPTYNPITQEVYNVETPEGRDKVIDLYKDVIEEGVITGYNSVEEAQDDLDSWYPNIVNSIDQQLQIRDEAYKAAQQQQDQPEMDEETFPIGKVPADEVLRQTNQENKVLSFAEGGPVPEKAPRLKKREKGLNPTERIAGMLGIKPEDIEWASSLADKYPDREVYDGRGDAARHLALGWIASQTENPKIAREAINARELLSLDALKTPESTSMDIDNNLMGFAIKAKSKEEAEGEIEKLIKDGQVSFMTPEESYELRGYKDGGEVKKVKKEEESEEVAPGIYKNKKGEIFQKLEEGNETLSPGVYQDEEGSFFQITEDGKFKALKISTVD